MRSPSPGLKKRQLFLLPLIMSIFFAVSGGPYAMEALVKSSGAGIALLLIVVTPFVWSLPAALMTAELTSAMPQEGGYYVWVREGLGPFAGFLCAWWSWVYSWVDISIYPGLFVGYTISFAGQIPMLARFMPTGPQGQWLLGLSMMVPLIYLNVRGIRLVGQSNLWLAGLLLAPFAILIGLGFANYLLHPHPLPSALPPGTGVGNAFGAGLFVIMWNYLGWDSLSTVAEETDSPQRTFPRALFWTLPLIVCCYLLPFAAGVLAVPDTSRWTEGSWPTIASLVGGRWLGLAVGAGAILSVLGMFNATLLGASRIPYVLAEDGFLPSWLAKMHPRFGTPWGGILISAAVAALLTVRKFDTLVTIDVLIYSAGLLLEFGALVALRYKRPDLARPYQIPGGKPLLWILVLSPIALIVAAFVSNLSHDSSALWLTLAALITGPAVYLILRLSRKWQPR